jgi:hypothetical protein
MKTTVTTVLRGVSLGILLIVLAGTLVASSAGARPHGVLLLEKTCDAVDHCAVVMSASGPFPVGTDINYLGPLLEARTTSSIVVTTPSGDTAGGHCSFSYRSWVGVCVITDGTGELDGLHANVRVTSDFESDPNGVFTWEGNYHFNRH